jgi:hypothetical protein
VNDPLLLTGLFLMHLDSQPNRKVPMPPVSKTIITIKLPSIPAWKSKPGSFALGWFFAMNTTDEEKPEDVARKYLLRILKDFQDKIFTETSEKLFRDKGLVPPYNFEVLNVTKGAVNAGDPDEYMVSGTGDPQSFIDWLSAYKIKFVVQKFVI